MFYAISKHFLNNSIYIELLVIVINIQFLLLSTYIHLNSSI